MSKFNHILEIDIKEWFDKTYGNSYGSARIYYDDKFIGNLSFQYGYGSHIEYKAYKHIVYHNLIRGAKKHGSNFHSFTEKKKIKVIVNRTENCLKRDVIDWGVS